MDYFSILKEKFRLSISLVTYGAVHQLEVSGFSHKSSDDIFVLMTLLTKWAEKGNSWLLEPYRNPMGGVVWTLRTERLTGGMKTSKGWAFALAKFLAENYDTVKKQNILVLV